MSIKNAGLLYVSLFAFGGEISLKYLIADLVTEFSPKFDNLKKLCEAFIYNGNRSIDVNLSVSDEYIEKFFAEKELAPEAYDRSPVFYILERRKLMKLER